MREALRRLFDARPQDAHGRDAGQRLETLVAAAPVLIELGHETQQARRQRLGRRGENLGQYLAQGPWTLARGEAALDEEAARPAKGPASILAAFPGGVASATPGTGLATPHRAGPKGASEGRGVAARWRCGHALVFCCSRAFWGYRPCATGRPSPPAPRHPPPCSSRHSHHRATRAPSRQGMGQAAFHRQALPRSTFSPNQLQDWLDTRALGQLSMNSEHCFLALILALLAGCGATEKLGLALAPAPDLARDRTVHSMEERGRTKIAKPQPRSPTAAALAGEPTLPPWSQPAPKPSNVLTSTLTPAQLFAKASPSVYAVTVRGQGARQKASHGSAVAVSATNAITNCHLIIADAKTITLGNGAAILPAEVVAADRATDRCVLRVLGGELEPVSGVRDYATLSVGEVVYTIGSPRGLFNTLGQGILSGLRSSEDHTEYVQITAPLSEGSSGGGLFDDRGNLIGVTSFTLRGSQNLNFAISGSQFWR